MVTHYSPSSGIRIYPGSLSARPALVVVARLVQQQGTWISGDCYGARTYSADLLRLLSEDYPGGRVEGPPWISLHSAASPGFQRGHQSKWTIRRTNTAARSSQGYTVGNRSCARQSTGVSCSKRGRRWKSSEHLVWMWGLVTFIVDFSARLDERIPVKAGYRVEDHRIGFEWVKSGRAYFDGTQVPIAGSRDDLASTFPHCARSHRIRPWPRSMRIAAL